MKTLVLYYSYGGRTRAIAETIAEKDSADIAEIKNEKRPGILKAFTAGALAAKGGKAWPIKPLEADLAAYDRLVLLFPIWAGHPAPFVNTMLRQLPEGKSLFFNIFTYGFSETEPL